MFENKLVPCRAVLSESEIAAAIEEGRLMTLEQAIAYALESESVEPSNTSGFHDM